jgi:hypothetical protein
MKEIRGNLFEVEADAICITTNGFVKANGEAVMGMGCAKTFRDKYESGAARLGTAIKKNGNRVNYLGATSRHKFYSFPVKAIRETNDGTNVVAHAVGKFGLHSVVPGFYCKARLEIIINSCLQLVEVADFTGDKNIVIPRMGCGAGELSWDDVRPVVAELLDDRFSIITF